MSANLKTTAPAYVLDENRVQHVRSRRSAHAIPRIRKCRIVDDDDNLLSGFDQQIGGVCETLESSVVIAVVRQVFNRIIVGQPEKRSRRGDQGDRLDIWIFGDRLDRNIGQLLMVR